MIAFWGVESSATVEVPTVGKVARPIFKFKSGEDTFEIYRHPELFLSEDIRAWYQEYSYGVKSIPYTDSNPKFHIACSIYDNYSAKFRSLKK